MQRYPHYRGDALLYPLDSDQVEFDDFDHEIAEIVVQLVRGSLGDVFWSDCDTCINTVDYKCTIWFFSSGCCLLWLVGNQDFGKTLYFADPEFFNLLDKVLAKIYGWEI